MSELPLSDCHAGALEKHRSQRMTKGMKSDAAALPVDSQFVQRRVKNRLNDLVPAERAAPAICENEFVLVVNEMRLEFGFHDRRHGHSIF